MKSLSYTLRRRDVGRLSTWEKGKWRRNSSMTILQTWKWFSVIPPVSTPSMATQIFQALYLFKSSDKTGQKNLHSCSDPPLSSPLPLTSSPVCDLTNTHSSDSDSDIPLWHVSDSSSVSQATPRSPVRSIPRSPPKTPPSSAENGEHIRIRRRSKTLTVSK